ncbi:concanavalin A-like lectin/glucanase, partial [Eremomyces bilateralis CBS 781.70]
VIVVTNVWNPTEHGEQCMKVTNEGSAFEVNWQWETDRGTVHSFPHVKFNSDALPTPLANISGLKLSGNWSFVAGDVAALDSSFDAAGLVANSVTANVAIDMFVDADPAKSQNETLAKYEILIWLGTIGQPYPLGWNEPTWNFQLEDAKYTLYRGTNQRGTTSFTWFPPINTTSFDTDFYPLLQFLIDNDLIDPSLNLGLVEFGQEAFYSTGKVTFAVNGYNMNLTKRDGGSQTVGTENPSGEAGEESGAAAVRTGGLGALLGLLAILYTFL